MGEIYRLTGTMLIGRGIRCDVRLYDQDMSREHCYITCGLIRVDLEDAGSTNGTFLNGNIIVKSQIKDGDKVQLGSGTVLKFSYQDDLEERFQRHMYDSALRDGLTGAYNKKYFGDRLRSEAAYASRHGTPLSCVMLDLDHFKAINDVHGHPAGDYTLEAFANIIHSMIREEDLFARWGGEEFVILTRGLISSDGLAFAERIRTAVEAYPFFFEGEAIRATVSCGISTLDTGEVNEPLALIAAADKAMYAAKEGGRNQSRVYSSE